MTDTKSFSPTKKKSPKCMTIEELNQKLRNTSDINFNNSSNNFNRHKFLMSSKTSEINKNTNIKENNNENEDQVDIEYQQDLNNKTYSRLKLNYKYNNNSKVYEFENNEKDSNINLNMSNNYYNPTSKLNFSNAFSPINNNPKNIVNESLLTDVLLENENEKKQNVFVSGVNSNQNMKKLYIDQLQTDKIDKDTGNFLLII